MTKEQLSQLHYLNMEIVQLQARIHELECRATSTTSYITGLPRIEGVVQKLGDYVAEIADLKSLLDVKIKSCFYELNRLERYIQSVEDSEMRIILSLRYVNWLSWQQIAFSMGENDESYPRKKHNRYIKLAENAESNVL